MNDQNEQHRAGRDDTGPQGTRVFRREDIEKHITGQGAAADAPKGNTAGAVLVGASGAFTGQRLPVPASRSTVGRDVANTIVVEDDSISLVHARLVEKNGEWRVLNLLSTNGTWINNRKVSDGMLRNGDSVCFGQVEFIFQISDPPPRAGVWQRIRDWVRGRRPA